MNKEVERALLIHEIQDTVALLGHVPKKNEFANSSRAIDLFGTWAKALSAAGYPYHSRVSDEQLKIAYRKKKEELGRTPKASEFQPYYQILLRKFGSWKEALVFLGEPQIDKKESDKEVLRAFYETHKRAPRRKDIPNSATICNRLGSGNWGKALRAAGIEQATIYKLSKIEIINLLKEKEKELGHVPIASEVPQAFTIMRRFGSWNNALKAAGMETWTKQHNSHIIISDKELLFEIQVLIASKDGDRPCYREFARNGLAVKRFKKWSNAVNLAFQDPYNTMNEAKKIWKAKNNEGQP